MNSDENAALSTPDTGINEDQTLALLRRGDIAAAALEKIAKDPAVSTSRKIKLALVEHPHTPRPVSLSLLRGFFTFDLMTVALMPVVATEIKIAAEGSLINRLDKLSVGEKLSLARRASARVVAALVDQTDARVVNAALESPRLTEAMLVSSLMSRFSSDLLNQRVRRHPKWSIRAAIQQALQRRSGRPLQNDRPESEVSGA